MKQEFVDYFTRKTLEQLAKVTDVSHVVTPILKLKRRLTPEDLAFIHELEDIVARGGNLPSNALSRIKEISENALSTPWASGASRPNSREIAIDSSLDEMMGMHIAAHETLHVIRSQIRPEERGSGYDQEQKGKTSRRTEKTGQLSIHSTGTLIPNETNEIFAILETVLLQQFYRKDGRYNVGPNEYVDECTLRQLREEAPRIAGGLARHFEEFCKLTDRYIRLARNGIIDDAARLTINERYLSALSAPRVMRVIVGLSLDGMVEVGRAYRLVLDTAQPENICSDPISSIAEEIVIRSLFKEAMQMKDPEHARCYNLANLCIKEHEETFARDWPKIFALEGALVDKTYMQPIRDELQNIVEKNRLC